MGQRSHVRREPVVGAIGVAIVLVSAGYLFAANAALAGGTDGRQPQDLPALVRSEVERADAAAAEVAELRADVDRLTDTQTLDEPEPEIDAAALALAAGLVPVTGPGLTVRLDDAPASAPRPEWATNDDLVVHQQDLQAVINALWAGGAEAMTLQGQRVVATSAFRCVGNVLTLHGRVYSPPYEVSAIGDPDDLRAALLDAPDVQVYLDYVDAVGLGWQVVRADVLELPASEEAFDLTYAQASVEDS